ncbi:hypothetical protein Aperf_G00000108101 [Anoplocephala perfoliata]
MELTPSKAMKTESQKTNSNEEGVFLDTDNESDIYENQPQLEPLSWSSVDHTTMTQTRSSGFGSSEGAVPSTKYLENSEKNKPSDSLNESRSMRSPETHSRRPSSVDSTNEKIIYPQRNCFHPNADSHFNINDHDSSSSSHNHSCRSDSHEAKDGSLLNSTDSYRIPENKSHRSRKNQDSKEKVKTTFIDTGRNVNLGFPKLKKGDRSPKKHADVIIAYAPNYLKAEGKKLTIATMTTSTSVGPSSDAHQETHRNGDSHRRWYTPEEVLHRYGSDLSGFEKSEILQYKKIYYFGLGSAKSTRRKETYNNGYDNKKGEYKTVLHDHINYRYEVIGTLGKGAFGEVVSAYDHKKEQKVALKIIRNRPNLHQQSRIEVRALKILARNDPKGENFTLRIFDDFVFRNHPCIVCELIGDNLYEVLKQSDFQGLPMKIIRTVAKCILKCLAILSKESIVHCDVKPENILLIPGDKPYVKLIDFGSNCRESEQIYTYVQSRFYRAPEVILGMRYTTRIDMWSLGCVLAELRRGIPLFPGTSEANQLECIADLLGEPPEEMLAKSTSLDKVREGKHGTTKLATSKRKTFEEELGPVDHDFKDFIRRCLVWKPEDRMSVEEALRHPWIRHDSSDSKKSHALGVGSPDLHNASPIDEKSDHRHNGIRLEWLQPLDPKIRNPRFQKAVV